MKHMFAQGEAARARVILDGRREEEPGKAPIWQYLSVRRPNGPTTFLKYQLKRNATEKGNRLVGPA